MTAAAPTKLRLAFGELVAVTAAAMALNALAVDIMLPALGIIGDELGAAHANDRQLIIVVYVIANGVAQLFFGPIVERFGRKRVLLWSLGAYILCSLLSVFAASFAMLLAARAFQGMATAGARVSALATVRDQCSGRRMAEVMSLAITIFMAAPILAPGIGQIILFFAPWRWIFIALMIYSLAFGIYAFYRLPETLAPENRKLLRLETISTSYLSFLRNRISVGYTLTSAFCFGSVFSYISASEQIFLEVFDLGDNFALAFAFVAGSLGLATLINTRLVSRFGMRRLAHTALFTFIAASIAHLVIASAFGETLPLFMICMMISFFALGLIGPNATALAMEPMGHNAGAAAALNGFAGTTIAGLLGGIVGRFFDGTTTPIILGFVVLGLIALMITIWTEKGRLFAVGAGAAEPAE